MKIPKNIYINIKFFHDDFEPAWTLIFFSFNILILVIIFTCLVCVPVHVKKYHMEKGTDSYSRLKSIYT